MPNRAKEELLNDLRHLLREAMRLRAAGASYAKLSRAHGYIDGYMHALMMTGLTTQSELLKLVSSERAVVEGPPTAEVSDDIAAVA